MSAKGIYNIVSNNNGEEEGEEHTILTTKTVDSSNEGEEETAFQEEEEEEEHTPLNLESQITVPPQNEIPDGTNAMLFSWKDPWLLTILNTLFLLVPILTKAIWITFARTGRMWITTLFTVHLTLDSWMSFCSIPFRKQYFSTSRWRLLVMITLLDVLLFGIVYPILCNGFIQSLLTEPDGTTVVEYSTLKWDLQHVQLIGFFIVSVRLIIGIIAWLANSRRLQSFRTCATGLARLQQLELSRSEHCCRPIRNCLRVLFLMIVGMSSILFVWCITSAVIHLGTWKAPSQVGEWCDPLDTTECCLPFPSFFHMVRNASTETGWRVHLQGKALPPLKGRISIDPMFLNELDGFNTMGPLLFYVEGLKEAHEQGSDSRGARLQGPSSISLSVTNRSITLLLDVDEKRLVPHSAEIDYLDPARPLVMVFPASPLRHNAHYALVVVNATDVDGSRLPPTPGMTTLLSLGENDESNVDSKTIERAHRYHNSIIPSLSEAAPWFSYQQDPSSLQLLYDFQTISATSQLGPVRSLRDAALRHITAPGWGDWSNHVHVIKQIDDHCSDNETLVARTIHAELDVPWYLQDSGSGHRASMLDRNAVESGTPVSVEKAKFVLYVPCSVKAAALDETNDTSFDLRAIMEFGHGLFANREEASDHFLLKMANDNGYIIMAMDWRGMSRYDLLVVVKTLMSTPRLFQSVRDNLIQGYVNKFALQHFSQNGMLAMDWLHFDDGLEKNKRPIPTANGQRPTSVFYGISQGGILGAGYTALSGPTALIERSILGSPGTPFSLIMTRSFDFIEYDTILLLNFYNNRHVRILLSLIQMAWDSVEGSGVLAKPIIEPFPRMLLQTGLGDSIVPTIAAEALSRALGAFVLPGNPRRIYGIPVGSPANGRTSDDGPYVTLTELLYKKEYKSLPADDTWETKNTVHYCVRQDVALIGQITEFVNSGRIIDPCKKDKCFRKKASC